MRLTKTMKIAMAELIKEGYYVILLNNEVFDFIATNTEKLRFIKTIFVENDNFSILKQKERLSKFYKYPKYYDDKMIIKNKCFSKELWIRSQDSWISKISIN
jgi:hypothetical protein